MRTAFGQALLDHHRGERDDPLLQRDGADVREHYVEDYYFGSFADVPDREWLASWIDGPTLDMGAGAGQHALYFQEEMETVAIEVCEALVTLLAERGIEDVRHGDMFSLGDEFEADRFRSAYALGTQVGLAKSVAGLERFLRDLAVVTTGDGTVVLDSYDPTRESATDMLGFRSDVPRGLASRVLHYEYAGQVDETLLFRLFSPDRFRAAARRSGWEVASVRRPHDSYHYRVALEKQR